MRKDWDVEEKCQEGLERDLSGPAGNCSSPPIGSHDLSLCHDKTPSISIKYRRFTGMFNDLLPVQEKLSEIQQEIYSLVAEELNIHIQ